MDTWLDLARRAIAEVRGRGRYPIVVGGTNLYVQAFLEGMADGQLPSYIAEGHVLDAEPHSFGGIGVFGTTDFARFYRYVLLEKQFPHHGAVAFEHAGRVLYDHEWLPANGVAFTAISEDHQALIDHFILEHLDWGSLAS